jgi:carboxyl-terminal processing protease
MKNKVINLLILLSLNLFVCEAQLSEKERFEFAKSLDIYNTLFKELTLFYVDSIDVKKTTEDNINRMLQTLDPYTVYIPEEDMSDFSFMITGEYGGIGSIISSRNGKVYVIEPYEGLPASLAGLWPGDIILEIDGEKLDGKNSTYASERLKGQPNTDVKIKYQRQGENTAKEVVITRKRIEIDPVTYYCVLSDNTGYIHLSGFTTHSAQSLKNAFEDLKTNKGITSLIIDVRSNPGGTVEDCLEILNYFLPKGELLLTMKGKARQLDKTYRATRQPLDADIPLAILVDNNSASASEILSGTIQDLDRGVVIGTRTYGKGLVQTSRQLPYEGRLKLTTAKYYIPSGRCIQAIDYSHRDENGIVSQIPDSLTSVFYTSKGRPVRDGAGVLPDLTVDEKKLPTLTYYLEVNNIFIDFIVNWRAKHPEIASPEAFTLTENDYAAFKEFAASKDFNYDPQSGKYLKNLKEIMEYEGYMDTASDEFKALENKLKPNLTGDLELYREQLSDYLAKQIMKHYYYKKGELIYTLRNDADVKKALEIFSNKELYDDILTVKDTVSVK